MAVVPRAEYELGFQIHWFCPSCGRHNRDFIPMDEANHEKKLMCWNCFQEVSINADESESGGERCDEGCVEASEQETAAVAEKGY